MLYSIALLLESPCTVSHVLPVVPSLATFIPGPSLLSAEVTAAMGNVSPLQTGAQTYKVATELKAIFLSSSFPGKARPPHLIPETRAETTTIPAENPDDICHRPNCSRSNACYTCVCLSV